MMVRMEDVPLAFVSAVLGDERAHVTVLDLASALEDDHLAAVDPSPVLAEVAGQSVLDRREVPLAQPLPQPLVADCFEVLGVSKGECGRKEKERKKSRLRYHSERGQSS